MTAQRAAELRLEFDRGFAAARESAAAPGESLLLIRVAGDPYALRVGELAGVFVDRVIVRVPGRISELLGVAGFRGATLPVFDLGALLGYPPAAAVRWLVTIAAEPVAFAFAGFEGYRHVATSAIVAHAGASHIRDVTYLDEVARPIIDLRSATGAIVERARDTKEA